MDYYQLSSITSFPPAPFIHRQLCRNGQIPNKAVFVCLGVRCYICSVRLQKAQTAISLWVKLLQNNGSENEDSNSMARVQ